MLTLSRRRGPVSAAILAALTLPLALAPIGANDPPEKSRAVFCPVAGLPKCEGCRCPSGYCGLQPRAALSATFEGGKLLFCCGKCKAMFEKAPEKFAANAHHQLVATGQARQVKCPLCGDAPKEAYASTVSGATVRFGSAECKAKADRLAQNDWLEAVLGSKAFHRAFVVNAGKK
jgi:YHS domain-containing protein